MRHYIILSALLICFASIELSAQVSGMTSYTFKISHVDKYLFRGDLLNDDSTLMGDLTIGIGSWSYQAFYAEPSDQTAQFSDETNHIFSYTMIQGRRVTTVGYQLFEYGGDRPDTQEFFTKVQYLTKWKPTYGFHYDFDTYKGYYFDYSFTRDYPLTRQFALQFNLNGGLAYELDEDFDEERNVVLEPAFFEDNGFTSSQASLRFLWQPLKWLSLETAYQYNYAWDDKLYDEAAGIERDQTVWRSTMTIRFP